MSPEGYIAQAAALQVALTVDRDTGHLLCSELPSMDVRRFLSALSEKLPALTGFSLSLVGYELDRCMMSDDTLRAQLKKLAPSVEHATTDIHKAAEWRNKPDIHERIITLVAGKHAFVSTLAHFPQKRARDLTERLLEWAQTPEASLALTSAQKKLLKVLAKELDVSSDLASHLSLNGVAAFFAAWRAGQRRDKNSAPRCALPQLGLLPDRALFSKDDIGERLHQNFDVIQILFRMTGHKFDELGHRIKRSKGARRNKRLDVFKRMEKLFLHRDISFYKALDLDEVLDIIRLKDDLPGPGTEPSGVPDPRKVSREAGGYLIAGDDKGLRRLIKRISESLAGAINGDKNKYPIDREFLTCIKNFCNEEAWGGFFEAKTASLEAAIRHFSECEQIPVQPHQATIDLEDEKHSYHQAISLMEQEFQSDAQDFCALSLWDRIVKRRQILLDKFDLLIHQPLLAMAADVDLRNAARELIKDWESLYGLLARNYNKMLRIDPSHTSILLEAIASLDVLQIKTRINARRSSWKAILLPTHPLHLWRYERMAELARGLKLDGMDHEAMLRQLQRPEHYLGVLYLTSFPKGKGGKATLPIACDHHGLAVFENLKNAYSGIDGIEALQRCVRQFPLIYVNHTKPLRLALVNPPKASEMLLALLKNKSKRRGKQTPLLVDIYATEDHEGRLLSARRFSSENRDEVEEHIATGRLRLRVHDKVISLTERLDAFHKNPVHILVVFDEATTEMRRQPGGVTPLPMSPFAIRRRISFPRIQKRVELRPSLEESVFRTYYDVLEKIDPSVGQTPQAWADAGRMRELIVKVLTEPNQRGAIWFFFADRALPSSASGRIARILEQREGRRRTVCYDANYVRLALPLRQPFDQFNLFLSDEQVEQLLKEGVDLLGDGLIDLFRADGKLDSTRVLGFVGMLVAARDYRERFPEALLVSVDTDLARLWLRVSRTDEQRYERCDLLALRKKNGKLLIEAIEVKTNGSGTGVVEQPEIEKASSQLASTLDAIQTGLPENEASTPLAAPRQEMLKEVFVSGCQSPAATIDDRTRWVEWLQMLFPEGGRAERPELQGTVCAVELQNNAPLEDKPSRRPGYNMRVRRIREERIQELVSSPQSNGDYRSAGKPSPSPSISASSAVKKTAHTQPEYNTPTLPSPRRRSTQSKGGDPSAGKPSSFPSVSASSAAKKTARTQLKHSMPTSPSPRRQSKTNNVSEELGLRFVVGKSLRVDNAKSFHLHPSDTRLNQLNIGIVGDLGTGKTQLTQALIHRFTSSPELNRGHAPKFLIFDYKQDYTKPEFVKAVGARVIAPPLPLNIFDLGVASDRTSSARLGRVKFLKDALQKIYGGIGPRQHNHLKTAVMQGYENARGNTPTLVDVLDQYKTVVGDRVDSPYNILSDLVDHEIFIDRAAKAAPFNDFFTGITVIDLASLGIGDRERNMLLALLLNLYYEYMINLEKRPYIGRNPQLRFIDSMLLVDEADNIMKYKFDVLRQILLQGREFGVGVLLASQYLSHFRTRGMDYSEPLLTWFVHKVPNVTARQLEAIGLNKVSTDIVEQIKSLGVYECLYKTYSVPGRFIQSFPFHAIAREMGALGHE